MGFGAWFDALAGAGLGLLIGSFLNVVVYRLPQMLARQWWQDCVDYLGELGLPETALRKTLQSSGAKAPVLVDAAQLDLLRPASRCRQCNHAIAWYENLPLLSYAFLRGKCSSCGVPIGLRYPLVELTTGVLFAFCVWRWGWTPTAALWCGFSAALLALALIDWDTTLLPDSLTLPLLWAGLLAAAFGLSGTALPGALYGAAAGYMSLWLVYWAFKLLTGKEGMGFGDFKLFAALGAWFGWSALVPIILMASVIGAVVGIALKFGPGLREGGYVPFGPFLAAAGFTAMFFGPQAVLRSVGL
ncbi:MAG: prepilin peptidase [Burkholderiaceae bacterium]